MKAKLQHLTAGLGKFASHTLDVHQDIHLLAGKFHKLGINLSMKSIYRIWDRTHTLEKPSKKTLDRLALLAGFQNWADLNTALHGDNDADLNFKD